MNKDNEINKVIQDIIEFEDLQRFASAQYNTLIIQSKKIHKLEEELEILQTKLQKKEAETNIQVVDITNDRVNDAETTCLVQLALLKNKSMLGELTLEETKKVEIYAKTLNLIRTKKSEDNDDKEIAKATDTASLLKLLDNKSGTEQ